MIDIGEARRAAARYRTSAPRKGDDNRACAGSRGDIYLVHALGDDELTAGVRQLIEEAGHRVSVVPSNLNRRGGSQSSGDQGGIDGMQRCGAMVFAFRPLLLPSEESAWQLGFFEALATPGTCIFLLPILEEGEIFEHAGFWSRYPVVELAAYHHAMSVEETSKRNWLRRLIGDRYPELMCRPVF